MITRVRVEASAKVVPGEPLTHCEQRVHDELYSAVGAVRDGGDWEEDELSITPTADGFWGRLTWRRK